MLREVRLYKFCLNAKGALKQVCKPAEAENPCWICEDFEGHKELVMSKQFSSHRQHHRHFVDVHDPKIFCQVCAQPQRSEYDLTVSFNKPHQAADRDPNGLHMRFPIQILGLMPIFKLKMHVWRAFSA